MIRHIAVAGRVITFLLCLQYMYLVGSLCFISAKEIQRQSYFKQYDIVELHEAVSSSDGYLSFTSHLIKRPLLPDNDSVHVFAPAYIVYCSIVAVFLSWRLLRDRQRRIHAPPYF